MYGHSTARVLRTVSGGAESAPVSGVLRRWVRKKCCR